MPEALNYDSGRARKIFGKNILSISTSQLVILFFIILTSFLLYLSTISRTLPTGDSGDLISAAWKLGVAHAPGYPTFTILGHLISFIPLGTPAFRINLLSAILDSLALGVLGYGLVRFISANLSAHPKNSDQIILIASAVTGVGLLAVSSTFWSYSIVAEVFALNNLFAAIILVFMLEWAQEPQKKWLLWVSALFAGLGLTNQLTIALLAPGLLILLFVGIVRWRNQARAQLPNRQSVFDLGKRGYPIREMAISIIFLFIGLLPYVYLPIAARTNPPVNWGNPSSLINFLRVVMRSDYGIFSFSSSLATGSRFQQLIFFVHYFINNFTWVGIILAVLGIIWFARNRQILGLGLGLAFLISGPLFMMIANPPLNPPIYQGVFQRFYIMPSFPFVFFIVAGTAWLLESVKRLADKKVNVLLPRTLLTLCIVASILGPIGLAHIRFPTLNLKDDAVAENFGSDLLTTLKPNSILLMEGDEFHMSVVYQQTVLSFRKDVIALDVSLLGTPWYINEEQHLHPDVVIPANVSDVPTLLDDFVSANLDHYVIYGAGLGSYADGLLKNFDEVYSGLEVEFLQKGDGPDMYALLRSESDYFASLHFPVKTYPDTSWEAQIASYYGNLALEIGWSRDKNATQPDADFIEKMYQIAILNDPNNFIPYWNLAEVLWHNGGSISEIQTLVTKCIQLVPEGTQKETAITFLNTIQNSK